MAIEQVVRRRVTNGITLLFYSHDELIVQTKDVSIIFHCWFAGASRRSSFRPFRKALMHRRNVDVGYIFTLASSYGVYHVTDNYGKAQKLLARIDKELPTKGESRNK